ncbi:MAG: branched-chain amino acid ABC transporter permease, partial [Enterobacterales bacterium]|nr:branched-chain amino acid ABC transporter permease [Enterobacterales bacterium]
MQTHTSVEQAAEPVATPSTFKEGVVDSLPIVIGYFPVAFAFGLTAVKLGFSP